MRSERKQTLDDEARAELRAICSVVVERRWNEDAWSAHESDDEFQTQHLCGGFDATERAFCFSYYPNRGKEFWFQLSLPEVQRLASSESVQLQLREAE